MVASTNEEIAYSIVKLIDEYPLLRRPTPHWNYAEALIKKALDEAEARGFHRGIKKAFDVSLQFRPDQMIQDGIREKILSLLPPKEKP